MTAKIAKIAKMFGGEGYDRSPYDLYRTPAWVTELLLRHINFSGPIWEPAAGDGDMAEVLKAKGFEVHTSDVRKECKVDALIDFANGPWVIDDERDLPRSIITNPPFALAEQFIRNALRQVQETTGQVALLLPYEYDAAISTRAWAFRDCPQFAAKIVLGRRISWVGLGDGSPRQVHSWYIWDHRRTKSDGFPGIIYS